MAVSEAAITQEDLVLPKPDHPVIMSNGMIDPVWYRFFSDLIRMENYNKELTNAIRTEVNTQHP